MFQKLFHNILKQRDMKRREDLSLQLIRSEAKIGGQLFGEVPKGHRREFFCLDDKTWVLHEEWTDANGQPVVSSITYDVRPDKILRKQNGHYYEVDKEESQRLLAAVKLYEQRVNAEMYQH